MTKPNRRSLLGNLDSQTLRAVVGGAPSTKETLASSVLKKADDTQGGIIAKLG